ncbi:MAG: PAC2 family protein [Candidatus Micrarchaeota archaeon]
MKEKITFSESFILMKKKPGKLRNPLLLVGLPGIGLVSKLAVDHLVKSRKAELFALLYSPHFPNQVLALKSGNLKAFSLSFYKAKLKNRDLILVRGVLQPLTVEGQYEVAAKILEFFKSMGGKEVLAMAGYAIHKKTDKPSIYCSSTNKQMLSALIKNGAKKNDRIVPVVGMAGLLPALSKLFDLKGACLLVETHGAALDANGAQHLLEFIGKLLKEKMDVKDLSKRAKKTQEVLEKIEAQARLEENRALAASGLPVQKDLTYIH